MPPMALPNALSPGRMFGPMIRAGHRRLARWAAIGPRDRDGRKFQSFGDRSAILHPITTLYNEHYITIGSGTIVGPYCSLSAGMVPGQQMVSDVVVAIGDRCLIGQGSAIVGHLSITIGNDVWTGPRVYITDQNHGYERIDIPIAQQSMPEREVVIGDGSWLGTGTVVLPGAVIGKHVTIGANSVVTGTIPDYSVAVGSPARVVRQLIDGQWVRPPS